MVMCNAYMFWCVRMWRFCVYWCVLCNYSCSMQFFAQCCVCIFVVLFVDAIGDLIVDSYSIIGLFTALYVKSYVSLCLLHLVEERICVWVFFTYAELNCNATINQFVTSAVQVNFFQNFQGTEVSNPSCIFYNFLIKALFHIER